MGGNLLNVPRTTPKPSLIWEMGGMKMKWRIIQKKLIFMNHVMHLDEGSLARQIQEVQEKKNLPGLTQECKELISSLKLPCIFTEKMPKPKWKILVKASVEEANEEEIRDAMKGYKKLRNRKIIADEYGLKEYTKELSLYESRTIFKHRTSMTQFVKLNYKGTPKYRQQGWKCDECLCLDSEDHLLWCGGYENLRTGLDLENYKQLSLYLHRINLIRIKKEAADVLK